MREGDPIVPGQRDAPPAGWSEPPTLRRRRTFATFAGSLLLHALLLVALLARHPALLPPAAWQKFVPVELVARSEGPEDRPAQQKAAGPRSAEPHIQRRAPAVIRSRSGVAPDKTAPDDLERQLRALSQLRQPNSDPRLAGDDGTTALDESGDDNVSGGRGDYHSRDIIRAQILRRWNLDLGRLGNRTFAIEIHVVLKRDGSVLQADILDKRRFASDAAFRWIALSARNAILLASPITLPPGTGNSGVDTIVTLDPRETLQ